MTIYIATRFTNRPVARVARATLVNAGYQVNARWLFEPPGEPLAVSAARDIEDVRAAHVLLYIEPPPETGRGPRGAFVEVGYALAQGKPVLVIDPAWRPAKNPADGSAFGCVFWSLPQVTVWPALAAAMPNLASMAFRLAERGATIEVN